MGETLEGPQWGKYETAIRDNEGSAESKGDKGADLSCAQLRWGKNNGDQA